MYKKILVIFELLDEPAGIIRLFLITGKNFLKANNISIFHYQKTQHVFPGGRVVGPVVLVKSADIVRDQTDLVALVGFAGFEYRQLIQCVKLVPAEQYDKQRYS